MTQNIQEEMARETNLQYEGLLARVEDQSDEIRYLRKQVATLKDLVDRLTWTISQQD